MNITQQVFADTVIGYVEGSDLNLDPKQHESQIPDLWVYYAQGSAMSGSLCLVAHGLFDQIYKRTIIIPTEWQRFCEQFYSPAARLLMQMHRECQRPSWLTWDASNTARDDSPMSDHFWTRTHQEQTYAALRHQLKLRGLTTRPTRPYKDDTDTFGVVFPGRVVDFPGTYRTLDLMRMELLSSLRYTSDIPRGIELYGDSTPVLHMIANTVEHHPSEIERLVANNTSPAPKTQHVVYVLSELRGHELIARHVGRMNASVLEIAYGSVAGAVHFEMSYLVPNDLSPDEKRSFDISATNWGYHYTDIIEQCPAVAEALAFTGI